MIGTADPMESQVACELEGDQGADAVTEEDERQRAVLRDRRRHHLQQRRHR